MKFNAASLFLALTAILVSAQDLGRRPGGLSRGGLGGSSAAQVSAATSARGSVNTIPNGAQANEDSTGIVPMIVGGTVLTSPTRYPWMVFVYFNDDRNIRCSAVLITSRVVLTAAHCFFEYTDNAYPTFPTTTTVEIGRFANVNEPVEDSAEVYDIIQNQVVLHPDFIRAGTGQPQDGGDFALIFLDSASTYKPYAKLSCDATVPTNVASIGWGATSGADPPVYSNTLKQASFNVLTGLVNNRCGADVIGPDMICATGSTQTPPADTCVGDSGGPLFVPGPTDASNDIVYGLTSFGNVLCSGLVPAVYSRISFACPWIFANVPELQLCVPNLVVGLAGEGCDGRDNDCNGQVDDCTEDTVPPQINLAANTCTAFKDINDVTQFLMNSLVLTDDCSPATLVPSFTVSSQTPGKLTFVVTVRDTRCNTQYSSSMRSFTFDVLDDTIPPNYKWSGKSGKSVKSNNSSAKSNNSSAKSNNSSAKSNNSSAKSNNSSAKSSKSSGNWVVAPQPPINDKWADSSSKKSDGTSTVRPRVKKANFDTSETKKNKPVGDKWRVLRSKPKGTQKIFNRDRTWEAYV